MAESERETSCVWQVWTAFHAALALAGFYLGETGIAEAGPVGVAAALCYAWAMVGGLVWHDKMRASLSVAGLAVAALGIAAVWLVIVGTSPEMRAADGVLRALGAAVLLASGIVLGETLGRRWANLIVFGIHGIFLGFGYILVDMLGYSLEAGRTAALAAVIMAPVIGTRYGEILGVSLWAAFAAALLLIKALQARYRQTNQRNA